MCTGATVRLQQAAAVRQRAHADPNAAARTTARAVPAVVCAIHATHVNHALQRSSAAHIQSERSATSAARTVVVPGRCATTARQGRCERAAVRAVAAC
ncbi:MAG: hypothetical protein EOP52_14270 [Sphingobacteriales bacterium]|nr:MAG: hypothetical protein EOP52_14270 [Sphingobacteriales bacterium]